MAIEIVSFPIENGDFPISYVTVYQRVYLINIPLNHYKIPLNHYKSLSISIKSHQKWWFSIVMSVYQRVSHDFPAMNILD